jgi:hypothetical protein
MDPYLALWMLARLIEPKRLPRERVVVRFDLTDRSNPDRYWVIAARRGNGEDGIVTTDAQGLVRWHNGSVSLAAAQRAGAMTVTAPRWLARTLSEWGRLSRYVSITPAGHGSSSGA